MYVCVNKCTDSHHVRKCTYVLMYACAINLLYIQKNYFASTMRARIPRVWTWWAVSNAVALFILLRPLTKNEIAVQWRKRQIMGKWLYSLFHLEPIEEPKH